MDIPILVLVLVVFFVLAVAVSATLKYRLDTHTRCANCNKPIAGAGPLIDRKGRHCCSKECGAAVNARWAREVLDLDEEEQ